MMDRMVIRIKKINSMFDKMDGKVVFAFVGINLIVDGGRVRGEEAICGAQERGTH